MTLCSTRSPVSAELANQTPGTHKQSILQLDALAALASWILADMLGLEWTYSSYQPVVHPFCTKITNNKSSSTRMSASTTSTPLPVPNSNPVQANDDATSSGPPKLVTVGSDTSRISYLVKKESTASEPAGSLSDTIRPECLQTIIQQAEASSDVLAEFDQGLELQLDRESPSASLSKTLQYEFVSLLWYTPMLVKLLELMSFYASLTFAQTP